MSVMWKYLDKRAAAIRALKDYDNMQFILKNTDAEISGVRDRMAGLGGHGIDGMPHVHDPQAAEDRILQGIEQIDVLKERYRQAVEYINWFKPAWDSLTEEAQYVLEMFYLVEDGGLTSVCEHFCIERSSAYNRKNRALSKLATCLYGSE